MDIDELRSSLRNRLQPLAAARGLNLELEPLFDGIPGMQTDEDAEIVRIAEKLTGHSSESVAFGTEGPFLSSLGMETIIMGPGDIALAHQPDEYLSLSHIQPAIDILRQLIKRFCL
jgi:acetylornithine deacetylase